MQVAVKSSLPFARSGSPVRHACFFCAMSDFTSSDESCQAPSTLKAKSRMALSLLVANARRTGAGKPLALTFCLGDGIEQRLRPCVADCESASMAALRTLKSFESPIVEATAAMNSSPPRSAAARIAATASAVEVMRREQRHQTVLHRVRAHLLQRLQHRDALLLRLLETSCSTSIISFTAAASPHITASVCACLRTSAFEDERHFARLAETSFTGLVTPPS